MNLADRSAGLLAAAGGDTVKLFDLSADPGGGDPCTLSYSPSPGLHVNSVKWNHTNFVVASAGDDKKISLWLRSGQAMGTIPVPGSDSGDGIEESLMEISFSNKGSRYMCSGGTGQVVRIWDLQRKRCIKWLRGHTDTISGVMYNCKDEHLASISLKGDLILHNLASGVRAAELKDPNDQVLRMLDYSRISRHLLVTAGDDGSVHLWDTTGRSPKASWSKQHSAPTAGVNFSPSNDKIITSVGLDKRLYTFDSGSRRPSFCISYEAPFSSLAIRDDGWMLAAGTCNGRVVFYDVRGKPQPLTVLRAYSSSEAVSSLCWQRSKPVIVNTSNCTAETSLLGGSVEDSILMPDPLPSMASSSISLSTAAPQSRNLGRSGHPVEASSFTSAESGTVSKPLHLLTSEETPLRNHLRPSGALARLNAPPSYNFKDDMDVFSPVVDVQPITPSIDKFWDEQEGMKKDISLLDKKPSSSRRFPYTDDGGKDNALFNWKSSSTPRQGDSQSPSFTLLGSTPIPYSVSDDTSITPPEAWGGEKISDKLASYRLAVSFPSRFMSASADLSSNPMLSGLQDISISSDQTNMSLSTRENFTSSNLHAENVSSSQETSFGVSEKADSSSIPISSGKRTLIQQANLESLGSSLALPRRFSTYAERTSTAQSFSDGTSFSLGSPKTKKTGAETREELLKSLLSRSDTVAAADSGTLPLGGNSQALKVPIQPDAQQGASFTLQLFQRTLEETLASFQGSIHADVRNLHIEILRQFHIHETEMSSVMKSIIENQSELMKEVQSLRRENQRLQQLL